MATDVAEHSIVDKFQHALEAAALTRYSNARHIAFKSNRNISRRGQLSHLFSKARQIAISGQLEKALAEIDKLSKSNPRVAAIGELRADVLYRLERWDEALTQCKELIERHPRRYYGYYIYAIIMDDQGNSEAALESYSKAIDLESNNEDLYLRRGSLFYRHLRLNPAIHDFSAVIELDKRNAWAHTARGWCYHHLNKFELAAEDHRAAISMEPRTASSYCSLGNALFKLGKSEDAKRNFDEALRLDPDSRDAYVGRARYWYNKKESMQACREYFEAYLRSSSSQRSIREAVGASLDLAVENATNLTTLAIALDLSNEIVARAGDDLSLINDINEIRLPERIIAFVSSKYHTLNTLEKLGQTEGNLTDDFDTKAAVDALVQRVPLVWSSAQKNLAKRNLLEAFAAAEAGLVVVPQIAEGQFTQSGGFDHVADETDRALAEFAPSLTVQERREIWDQVRSTSDVPVPELTPADIAAIKRRAEKSPWAKRPTHRYSAFKWVQEHYEKWIPGLLQHHLKFDKSEGDRTSLYDAFAQRVGREGLPEWLDVPTEKEAELRNTPDPLDRAKILAVRRFGKLQARGVRALRQLEP